MSLLLLLNLVCSLTCPLGGKGMSWGEKRKGCCCCVCAGRRTCHACCWVAPGGTLKKKKPAEKATQCVCVCSDGHSPPASTCPFFPFVRHCGLPSGMEEEGEERRKGRRRKTDGHCEHVSVSLFSLSLQSRPVDSLQHAFQHGHTCLYTIPTFF